MLSLLKYEGRMIGLKSVFAVLFLSAPVWADATQVLVIGDSLTHGYGLPAGQGFVPQMQNWLQENDYDVELINAGVSGDTTSGGVARLEWLLTPEIDAVVIELGANDALRGIDPALIAHNLREMVEISQNFDLPVLLMRVPGIGNYGVEYQASYDRAFTDLVAQSGISYIDNFFSALLEKSPEEFRNLMQSDGIHPNPTGVELIVSELGPELGAFLSDSGL